jgi:hypothetical protein
MIEYAKIHHTPGGTRRPIEEIKKAMQEMKEGNDTKKD